MYQCGCYLASLSTAMEYLAGSQGSLPWYSVPVTDPYGFGHTYFDFSPIYMHLYLRNGNLAGDRHAPNSFWGYLRNPPMSCGVELLPGASERAANPSLLTSGGQTLFASPTGLSMKWHGTAGLNAAAKDIINRRLLEVPQGKPTLVGIKVTGGQHVQIIAGWDNTNKQYLIFDPFMLFPILPSAPGGGDPAKYAKWEKGIFAIGEVDRAFHSGTNILGQVRSPLELLAIAPDGRRTGFDPAKATFVNEDPSGSYYQLGGWTDPTGQVLSGEPVKLLEIADPPEGVYRFQATGTGAGPFELEFSTGSSDNAARIFQGVTGLGDVRKYEVQFSASGAMSVAQVQNFTPQARISSDSSTSVGAFIAFDGAGSFDVDGTVTSYSWDFGDGTTGSGNHTTHSYSKAGRYTTTLTVSDGQGATGTAKAYVSVIGPIGPQQGPTELVSLSTAGELQRFPVCCGESTSQISADGRFVAFKSRASNLVSGDTNGVADIFVRDRQAGTTERVNVSTTGAQDDSPRDVGSFSVSADGRFVVFDSLATSLVPATSGGQQVYVRDRVTRTTELVSLSSTGEPGNGSSFRPSISADGRFVAFTSVAPDLVPDDTNGVADIFVRDRLKGTTERVNLSSGGAQANPGGGGNIVGSNCSTCTSDFPQISADGRLVSFTSQASNLVPNDTNQTEDVFVHDRLTHTTERVSVSSSGEQQENLFMLAHSSALGRISADGRFVVFTSQASNLVAGDATHVRHIFIRDRLKGLTERVDLSSSGQLADGPSDGPSISADGRFVAFHSSSGNLKLGFSPDDVARWRAFGDVFVRDRLAASTELLDISQFHTFGTSDLLQALAQGPSISGDGRYVSYSTNDPMILSFPITGDTQIYIRDRGAGRPAADASGPYLGWANSTEVPGFINFDARKSFDPGGTTLTARWDFGDGSPQVTASVSSPIQHAYSSPGNYTVKLMVSNGADEVASTTNAEVLRPLAAPKLSLPSCSEQGGKVTIELGSFPLVQPAGGWNFGGLPSATSGPRLPDPAAVFPQTVSRLSFSGPGSGSENLPVMLSTLSRGEFFNRLEWNIPQGLAPGRYTLVAEGLTGSLQVPCPQPQNHVPLADAGGPYSAAVGLAATFDGSHSSDADGDPLTFSWDFGDGTSGAGVNPQHSYASAGNFLVTLTVSDGKASSIPSVDPGFSTRSFAKVTIAAGGTSDTVAPTTAAASSPMPNAAGWNNRDVTVALTATDNLGGSGVVQISYSATGAQLVPSTNFTGNSTDIVITAEGVTTISFFATDRAGNVEAAKTLVIRVDKTPPTITTSRTPSANVDGWNKVDVTVNFSCADSLSGISTCGPASQVISSDGANQSRAATATDLAGNTSSAVVAGINIDKTPPTLTCSAVPGMLWPPNHKLVSVSTAVNVRDNLSGSGGFVLQSVTSNEPDDGLGDGDTANDIQGWDFGTADMNGSLRAERSGSGAGRVYSLSYQGADKAGNAATCTTTVAVPHDRK